MAGMAGVSLLARVDGRRYRCRHCRRTVGFADSIEPGQRVVCVGCGAANVIPPPAAGGVA